MLRHEVAVLRRTHPRPRADWAGRAVLAVLIWLLPGKLRAHRLVTPGTAVRWRRRLITRQWTYPTQTGRPPFSADIAALPGRLATGEPRLGLPADPGCVADARSPGRCVHDPPDPHGPADPAGAGAAR